MPASTHMVRADDGSNTLETASAAVLLRLPLDRRTKTLGAALAASVSAASFVHFGVGLDGWCAAFFGCVLIALSLVDLDRHKLPNRLLLPSTAVLAIAELIADPGQFRARLIAAGAAFVGFLLLALIYPPGLGMGDVKLVLFLGIGLGGAVIYAITLSAVAASLVSLVVLVRRGRKGRKVAIPFAPFLALGALVVLFVQ
jgi:leader peptidase (prepilin peptidase) / N-methyltransferase